MFFLEDWHQLSCQPEPILAAEWYGLQPPRASAPSALPASSSSAPDPMQALMEAGSSALQFGADVAETAASVAQAAERGGLMPLIFRAVTGRWRALRPGRAEPPAGLLAPPEGADGDAP